MKLSTHVAGLVKRLGGIRAASRELQIDAGYLSRLMNEGKDAPSDAVLSKLGLRREIRYFKAQKGAPR